MKQKDEIGRWNLTYACNWRQDQNVMETLRSEILSIVLQVQASNHFSHKITHKTQKNRTLAQRTNCAS